MKNASHFLNHDMLIWTLCTNFEEQKGTRYIWGNVYIGMIVKFGYFNLILAMYKLRNCIINTKLK